ncbi:MAG: oxygenase MpaB family protein [Mycobacteriaceae bacterium]
MTRDFTPAKRFSRTAWVRHIESLDPLRDNQEIHRITAGYEFPWDYQRALEFALFKTYCVPTISMLLRKTGEFGNRPQKRYDDTALLMGELVEHGYDSPRGKESLRMINRMHGQYSIKNDDMLYTLSTFIYDPIDWMDKFGWRSFTPKERLAAFYFYKNVGTRMGIKDIPETYEEFFTFKFEYERKYFVYSDDNRAVGNYTLDLYCSWFPNVFDPFIRKAVYALIDPGMARAFGFPEPSHNLARVLGTGLTMRAKVVRLLPPRQSSRSGMDPKNKTYPGYPEGYTPSQIGALNCPMSKPVSNLRVAENH